MIEDYRHALIASLLWRGIGRCMFVAVALVITRASLSLREVGFLGVVTTLMSVVWCLEEVAIRGRVAELRRAISVADQQAGQHFSPEIAAELYFAAARRPFGLRRTYWGTMRRLEPFVWLSALVGYYLSAAS